MNYPILLEDKRSERDMREIHEYCDIPMERMVNQCIWFEIMGYIETDWELPFENDTFYLNRYSWNEDDNNEFLFYHKPSGFKMSWYKYALRSPYANMKITHEEFYAIVEDCMNSTPERINAHYVRKTYEKWWLQKEIEEPEKQEEKPIIRDSFNAREYVLGEGYEDVVLFDNPSYDKALIGVTSNFKAVYDYDLMILCLLEEYPDWDEQDAIDWIEYNSLRAAQYIENGPEVVIVREDYGRE